MKVLLIGAAVLLIVIDLFLIAWRLGKFRVVVEEPVRHTIYHRISYAELIQLDRKVLYNEGALLRSWGFDPGKPITWWDDPATGDRTYKQEVINGLGSSIR